MCIHMLDKKKKKKKLWSGIAISLKRSPFKGYFHQQSYCGNQETVKLVSKFGQNYYTGSGNAHTFL